MSQPASLQTLSIEEYLAGEQDGEIRHEYVAGHVYAMTGASASHGLIVNALAYALTPKAREHQCQLFTNDMKVHIRSGGEDFFYYPDLLLSCDPNDRADYYRESPCLIIEVLSEHTERIDRREKLHAYTSLASLREYLLVAQNQRHVEHYRRTEDDWRHAVHTEGRIPLECLDMELALDAIYMDAER